jgi:predicted 2-oxoglutarate/Fe(II)-dependent dioxygenase YbiX
VEIDSKSTLPQREMWGGRTWEGLDIADRVISIVVQLSNTSEYDGGELQVITGTAAEPALARPEANAVRSDAVVVTAPSCPGDVLIFPSLVVHQVKPVTHGRRHSLVWSIPKDRM